MSPFSWIDEEIERLRQAGMERTLHVSSGPSMPQMEIASRTVFQFSSNNYLGMATHPRVLAAAENAQKIFGVGAGASRLISGSQSAHAELEGALAHWKGAEAALVYASGTLANLGLLPSLAGTGDLIVLDKAVHASLYDGAKLSGARILRFAHGDLGRLEKLLTDSGLPKPPKRLLIVVEGVYSMDGDVAALPELLALARRHSAMVVVDEAHSSGVIGAHGAGILEHHGIPWHPHLVVTGTLSKALGSLGGFVAGSESLIHWLRNTSRTFIFATALPAVCAAAAAEAIKVIRDEPDRHRRLWKNRAFLVEGLLRAGWSTGISSTPILPITVGAAASAVSLQRRLWERGFYVPAIRPPTVPASACRLRLTVTSEHTEAQISGLLEALGGA